MPHFWQHTPKQGCCCFFWQDRERSRSDETPKFRAANLCQRLVALPRRTHFRAPSLLNAQHKMPSLEVDDYGVTPVTSLVRFFEEALDAASAIKPTSAIDPPLEDADLKAVLDHLPTALLAGEPQDGAASRQDRHHRFAVIETAARGVLSNLIVCYPSTFRVPD